MRGRKITPEQIELIKATYAETESITQAAEAAGVPRTTATQYVGSDDEFAEVRREKRIDIIEAIAHARALYAEHLAKPTTIAGASAKDAATVLGILTDKHQLLTGGATQRNENVNVDTARETLRDRIERLARRRSEGGDELKVV